MQDEDPVHDPSRLRLLEEVEAATVSSSAELDEFAKNAAAVLAVPVSLITFVEADRQIFKGEHGLPATLAIIRKMPISYSICQFTIRDPRPLIIPDTDLHPLLKNHPSVREMGVRAYLGIPLTLAGSTTIGSLSFVSYTQRSWSDDDLFLAKNLAAQVVEMLEKQLYVYRQFSGAK